MKPSQTQNTNKKERKADVFAESEGSTAYKLKKQREEKEKQMKKIREEMGM